MIQRYFPAEFAVVVFHLSWAFVMVTMRIVLILFQSMGAVFCCHEYHCVTMTSVPGIGFSLVSSNRNRFFYSVVIGWWIECFEKNILDFGWNFVKTKRKRKINQITKVITITTCHIRLVVAGEVNVEILTVKL